MVCPPTLLDLAMNFLMSIISSQEWMRSILFISFLFPSSTFSNHIWVVSCMNGKDAKTSSLPQPRSHTRKTNRY